MSHGLVVMIYGFNGKFTGKPEFEWRHPELGATHNCILFLRQEVEGDRFEDAEAECRRFGFTEFQNMRVGKLRVEVLNSDLYRGFADFYEEALREGSALVYYPNDGEVVAMPAS